MSLKFRFTKIMNLLAVCEFTNFHMEWLLQILQMGLEKTVSNVVPMKSTETFYRSCY